MFAHHALVYLQSFLTCAFFVSWAYQPSPVFLLAASYEHARSTESRWIKKNGMRAKKIENVSGGAKSGSPFCHGAYHLGDVSLALIWLRFCT